MNAAKPPETFKQLEVLAPPMIRHVPPGWVKSNWTRLARVTLLDSIHVALKVKQFVEAYGADRLRRQAVAPPPAAPELGAAFTDLGRVRIGCALRVAPRPSRGGEIYDCREQGRLGPPLFTRTAHLSEDELRSLLADTVASFRDVASSVRKNYELWFPEIAHDQERLSDQDLRTAAAYMARQKPSAPGPRGQAKWDWLAAWMIRIGIGTNVRGEPITAAHLKENEWKKWRAANRGKDSTPTI